MNVNKTCTCYSLNKNPNIFLRLKLVYQKRESYLAQCSIPKIYFVASVNKILDNTRTH